MPLRRRVLLVDDSPFARRAFRRVLRDVTDVEIAGEAADGLEALSKVALTHPDVVLLDLGMPGMDGLSVLEHIQQEHPQVAVVVVSTATHAGAEATLRALELGAFDFVDKSAVPTMQLHSLKEVLVSRIRAAKPVLRTTPQALRVTASFDGPAPSLLCIGASTGGPQAIAFLAQRLPPGLPCPVVVVQHIAPSFVAAFASRLSALGPLPAAVARPDEALAPGCLYVAPGGMDVEVSLEPSGIHVRPRPAPANAPHAPSVDSLFISAARALGARAAGLLLTGMGRDGAEGLLALKRAGAFTLAEHASSCAVYGMPRAAIELGAAAAVVPLHLIPQTLSELFASPASPVAQEST
jgi:two-component system chemotaxis response regulator CheB